MTCTPTILAALPQTTLPALRLIVLGGENLDPARTGDLARRLPDGQLVFVGRMDRQLNLGGFRLEPAEVEKSATLLPGVTAAAVLADGELGQQVLVLHAAVPAADVTVAQLRSHLAQRLPAPAVPARIYLWPQLPITDSGKPDLPALATLTPPPAPEEQAAAVGLPDQVAHWWEEAAGTPPVAGKDFFEAGGDSLAAVRLLHEINETYGTAITITDFVADPIPDHLARALAEHPREAP